MYVTIKGNYTNSVDGMTGGRIATDAEVIALFPSLEKVAA